MCCDHSAYGKKSIFDNSGYEGQEQGKEAPLSQNLIYIGRSGRHASRVRKCIDPALFYDLIQP